MRSILLLVLFISVNLLSGQNNGKNKTGNKGGGCLLQFHKDTLNTQILNSASTNIVISWDNNRTQTIPTCLYQGFHCIIEKQINFGGYDTIFDSWNDSISRIIDTSILNGATYNYRISRFNHATYLTSYSDTINLRTVGLSELKFYQFRLFPNPTKQDLTLQFKSKVKQQISLQVLDINGKIILEDREIQCQDANCSKTYNVSSFPKGVYYIKLNSKLGYVKSYKFIKV